jgi:long-chain acyl-CoA synthetase
VGGERLKMKKILLLGAMLLSLNVHAKELAGVAVADSVQVGGQTLVLNGAGIRTKFFFKIYVGALYLPQKQTSGEAIIADEHPHRMALHILHELSSEKLFNAVKDAMEDNQTAAGMAALAEQMQQMGKIFDTVKMVKPGDVITLDYLPDSGTQISVNGTARGTISGVAFNRALLRIWLGEKPIQADLKKELLGG